MRRTVLSSAAILAITALAIFFLLRDVPVQSLPPTDAPEAEMAGDAGLRGRPDLAATERPPPPVDPEPGPEEPRGEDVASASIRGAIANDIGSPVRNATVLAIDSEGEPRHRVTSDTEGRFSFDALTPGRWRLSAVAVGHAPDAGHDMWAPGFATITLQRQGGIRFGLRLPASGGVLSHATVWVHSPSRGTGRRSVVAREAEAYVLHDALPGIAEVSIRVPGYLKLHSRQEIQAGEVTDLGTLDLSVGVMVSGRIEDASGKPIYALEVRVDGETQGRYSSRDGEFTLGPVATGACAIRVLGGMRYLDTRTVVHAEEAGAPVVITVSQGALLRGRVRRADDSVDPARRCD